MANDRYFLVCNKCKNSIMIMKYYPGPGGSYVPSYGDLLNEKLDTFMTGHIENCWGWFKMDLEGAPGFSVLNEWEAHRVEENK